MNRLHFLPRARREAEGGNWLFMLFWATLVGLLIPFIVALLGVIVVLLDEQGLSTQLVAVGKWLRVPMPIWVLDLEPLGQLLVLVLVTLGLSALLSLAVYLHRLLADTRARRIVRHLHDRVLDQSLRRAENEGAAAGQLRANELISVDLPALQTGLSLWYRSIPRSILSLITCVGLALLVDLWLALVAVVTGWLLWRWLIKLRTRDDRERIDWQIPRLRDRMADLVSKAPLLARMQTPGLTNRAFKNETDHLYRRLEAIDRQAGRVWPLIFLAIAIAIAILILGLGVNSFLGEGNLRLPAAAVLVMALSAASLSASRLISLRGQLKIASEASDNVYQFLEPLKDIPPSEQRVGLATVRDGVRIDGVTLSDSANTVILDSLSLALTRGSMVSVLGTGEVSVRALVELLMGFGSPTEGRVSIDGIPIRDIHPKALAENVMWIEPSGPIWDGSILDNVRGTDETISNVDIVEALKELDIYERLNRLTDGLSTIVSSTDNSLGDQTTYSLAIARAMVHRVPILIASEPPAAPEHFADDPCLAALRKLRDMGTIVVVLPTRLLTLRQSDRVVLLNGPRLAGEGTHSSLLGDSDLYRHLNYLLFNPYRQK